MTTKQYLEILHQLDLAPYGVKASQALGLKMRQLARLAAGTTKPSPMLARLLEALIALKAR